MKDMPKYTSEEKALLLRLLDAKAKIHWLVPTAGNVCRRKNCLIEGNEDNEVSVRKAIDRGGPVIWVPKHSGFAVMDADPKPEGDKRQLTYDNIDQFLEEVRLKIGPAAIIPSRQSPGQHILIRIDETVSNNLKNPPHYYGGVLAGEIKHSVQCTIWHPTEDFVKALLDPDALHYHGHRLLTWMDNHKRSRKSRKRKQEEFAPPPREVPSYLQSKSLLAASLSVDIYTGDSNSPYFRKYDLDSPIPRGQGTSHYECIGRLRQAAETLKTDILQKTCSIVIRDRKEENPQKILAYLLNDTDILSENCKAFLTKWIHGEDADPPPKEPADEQEREADDTPPVEDAPKEPVDRSMDDVPFDPPARHFPGCDIPNAAPKPPASADRSYKPVAYAGSFLENGQYVVHAPNIGSDAFLEAMRFLGYDVGFEEHLQALVRRPIGSKDYLEWEVITPSMLKKLCEQIEQDCARVVNTPKGKPEPRSLKFNNVDQANLIEVISVTHSFSLMVAWLDDISNRFIPTDHDRLVLETWLQEWGAEDNELSRYLTRSMILGVVQRTYNPGSVVRMFPVLVGKRKLGKSALVRSLLPPELPSVFRSESFSYSKETRESAIALRGVVIAETSEMVGASKSDNASMKSFLTAEAVTFRPLYSNQTIQQAARFMLIGTANDDVMFLSDDKTTAARSPVIHLRKRGRDPVKVLNQKDEYGFTLRDRLFATAVHVWRESARKGVIAPLAYPPDAIEPLADESVRDFQYINDEVPDCVTAFLQAYMYKARRGATSTEIVTTVFEGKTLGFATPTRIGQYLSSQSDWIQRRANNQRIWIYIGGDVPDLSQDEPGISGSSGTSNVVNLHDPPNYGGSNEEQETSYEEEMF